MELPAGCNATDLFLLGVKAGVSITPGVLFSASGKYKRCARLSYGLQWNKIVEEAVAKLGQLSHQLVAQRLELTG